MRRAINDPQIIAAVVDATPVTVPLFNAAGVLQVAPGGDVGLAPDPNAHAARGGRRSVGLQGRCRPTSTSRFREAFGRAPGAGAEDGYRAMAGVLRAIGDARARPATTARRVIDAYLLALSSKFVSSVISGTAAERLGDRAALLGALRGLLEAGGVEPGHLAGHATARSS